MDLVTSAMLFLLVAFIAWLAPSIVTYIYLKFYYQD